ncbi:MAG TPA: extracellular solute-binding protein [Candidatus Dormibacteraeota bacterium]|jgi:multiple sugar transport system substrate-binding protein|nr:extracellular solute-binding protein [Candidatus Dormibacteraeota bacterium]
MRNPLKRLGALLALLPLALLACGNNGGNTATTDNMKGTITVAYSTTYVFDSDDTSVIWWNKVKSEFEAAYPNAKLNLQGFNGTDVDLVNKVALEYKSASTTPDVFMLPSGYVGQWQASDYLLPLDKWVNDSTAAPFWASFPKVIQDESRINGKVYAINTGENNTAIYYNNAMLQKAGITLPWAPKNWDDILTAARAVKASNPGVIPLWTAAGTSAGAGGVLQGSANLVYGSSTPTIFDYTNKKWVVDSPGLREVFNFYKSVYSEKLGASTSDLFSPKAVGRPVVLLKDKQLAIAVGSNWFADAWTETNRHWATAAQEASAVPLPTSKGQAPGTASTLGGWAIATSKVTQHPELAWGLIKIMESADNQTYIANRAGFVPPSQAVAKSDGYLNFAPPFNKAFGDALPNSRLVPSEQEGYPAWVQGIGQATGQIATDPSTSVDAAIKILHDTVANQVGADKVETLNS